MKNLKNGHDFVNMCCIEHFQISDPPQSLGLWYNAYLQNGDHFAKGVGNLKFFHMTYIYEMAAIFLFFHNGQC